MIIIIFIHWGNFANFLNFWKDTYPQPLSTEAEFERKELAVDCSEQIAAYLPFYFSNTALHLQHYFEKLPHLYCLLHVILPERHAVLSTPH